MLGRVARYFRISGDPMMYVYMAFAASMWWVGAARAGLSERDAAWSAIAIFVALMIAIPPYFRALESRREKPHE
jgi:hypothetical protein